MGGLAGGLSSAGGSGRLTSFTLFLRLLPPALRNSGGKVSNAPKIFSARVRSKSRLNGCNGIICDWSSHDGTDESGEQVDQMATQVTMMSQDC